MNWVAAESLQRDLKVAGVNSPWAISHFACTYVYCLLFACICVQFCVAHALISTCVPLEIPVARIERRCDEA